MNEALCIRNVKSLGSDEPMDMVIREGRIESITPTDILISCRRSSRPEYFREAFR